MGGITLVSNTIILDIADSQDSGFLRCANSYLLYDNLIYSQNSTITSSQEGSDSAGVLALKDGNTNLKFYSDGSSQVDIDVTLPLATQIDCMAFAGANLTECLASWQFFVYDPVLGDYNLRAQGSGKKDNSPVFLVFDEIQTPRVRFRFFVTGVLRIGEIACGKALRFPTSPALGFRPSKWQSDKDILTTTTEGNTISNSNVKFKMVRENPTFPKLPVEWVDEYWPPVLEKGLGLPVWFGWNQKLEPNNVVCGMLKPQEPNYESSLLTSLSFGIEGNK